MCIYCGTNKYRKIYENHYGPIPKDEEGRSFEIHHIDGDHSNNDPNNLQCVSLQQHYDIHYSQGDWIAAHRIGGKLKLDASQLSILATKNNIRRVKKGTHPFLGGEQQRKLARARLDSKTHHFLSDDHPSKKKVRAGTHHFFGGDLQREVHSRKKICEHCGKEVGLPNYGRWHGPNCRMHPRKL